MIENTGGRIPTNLRALRIIEVLADSGRPLTPTEINEILGLPKPTIHRLCQTLISEGYLARDVDANLVRPARRMRGIASGLLNNSHLHIARHNVLQALSEEIGETCNIAIPEAAGMVYMDRVETQWPMRIQLPVGTHVPFHCTASGKLFLSTFTGTALDILLTALNLEKLAQNTITSVDAMKQELETIRTRGFSQDNEEFMDSLVAIAVPVRDANNRLFAALAFHAPVQRMDLAAAQNHLPRLRQAADQLSTLLFS